MIETVLGSIGDDELGVASMHEHLLCDARILRAPAREAPPESRTVTIENLGFLRWNLLSLDDNLVLEDARAASDELQHAADLGQRAVIELTSWGLGACPGQLPSISRATGMHIVAGCGVYLDRPHPEWLSHVDDQGLADLLVSALTVDYDGSGFRAGLLGLIGTGEPITASEQRVLLAAADAASRTGAPVAVRLAPSARRGSEVLRLLTDAGCPAEKVIFSNVDEFLDLGYLRDLARSGATLEWCFGNEAYYGTGYKDPSDAERLAALVTLLSDEPALETRCVLGCSVWTKSQLRRYGGMGHDHLLRRIVPELNRHGLSDATIATMLTSNPARLLSR